MLVPIHNKKKQIMHQFVTSQAFESRYTLHKQIGQGSFGTVYKAFDLQKGRDVALKIGSQRDIKPSEVVAMQILSKKPGFPRLYNSGTMFECRYISMQLLGSSIANTLSKSLGFEEVSKMYLAILSRLKTMHLRGLIHRDLKPQHFLHGLNDKQLYLADFGLATWFSRDCEDIRPVIGKVAGNARFCSLRAHYFRDVGPCDDIESLTLIAASLLQGSLPWDETEGSGKNLWSRIRDQKAHSIRSLWIDSLPLELGEILKYLQQCKMLALPDYNHIQRLARQMQLKSACFLSPHLEIPSKKQPDGDSNQATAMKLSNLEVTNVKPLNSRVNPSRLLICRKKLLAFEL